jgi:hypothetical protein
VWYGSRTLPTEHLHLGKDIMGTQVCPTLDTPHLAEVLEAAQKILQCHHDHELVQRVTVVKGWLSLIQMFPSRNYQDTLRKALDDLIAVVHFQLQREGSSQTSSTDFARTLVSL